MKAVTQTKVSYDVALTGRSLGLTSAGTGGLKKKKD